MTRDLIHFKVVLWRLGLSRTSVWRAMRAQIPNFPGPIIIRRRLYWRESDLPRLEQAMLHYAGRTRFERQRSRTASAIASSLRRRRDTA